MNGTVTLLALLPTFAVRDRIESPVRATLTGDCRWSPTTISASGPIFRCPLTSVRGRSVAARRVHLAPGLHQPSRSAAGFALETAKGHDRMRTKCERTR